MQRYVIGEVAWDIRLIVCQETYYRSMQPGIPTHLVFKAIVKGDNYKLLNCLLIVTRDSADLFILPSIK